MKFSQGVPSSFQFLFLTSTRSLNRNELCSFWAFLGECDKNQAFMLTNCAPSCKSCHLIDMDARCPPLADATPALKPGDLNKMFENIVKDAPGNRTLTNEERKELKDKMTPEYTVTVHSRPSSSPAIEVSSVLDKSLPPWIITFDNFLTPEECQTLIDLGHKAGYERSRDVGKQNFDGSFDGLESTGRTSENAWCSGMKGCRQDEVVQRVMDRMGAVMGIPADNSEDLQILKYEKTQFYNAHHDYIPVSDLLTFHFQDWMTSTNLCPPFNSTKRIASADRASLLSFSISVMWKLEAGPNSINWGIQLCPRLEELSCGQAFTTRIP